MKVKLLTSMVGNSISYSYGDIVDMKENEAQRMVKAGLAEFAGSVKPVKIETASIQPETNNVYKPTIKKPTAKKLTTKKSAIKKGGKK